MTRPKLENSRAQPSIVYEILEISQSPWNLSKHRKKFLALVFVKFLFIIFVCDEVNNLQFYYFDFLLAVAQHTREKFSLFSAHFRLLNDWWFFFIFLQCHWWSQQDETFVLIKRPWQRFFSSLEWIFNAMQMKKQQNVSRELTRKIF